MTYLIFSLILITVMVLVLKVVGRRRLQRKTEEIRNAWGKPKTSFFNFALIANYATQQCDDESVHRLSAQTVGDIDLENVFQLIDRTASKPGQQLLWQRLTTPGNQSIHALEPLIATFANDSGIRESAQLELHKLDDHEAYYIASLFQDVPVQKPRWYPLIIANVVLTVALLLAALVWPAAFLVLIMPLTINMGIHYWNKGNMFAYIRSIPQLNNLINVTRFLSAYNFVDFKHPVKYDLQSLKSFQRKSMLIDFDNKSGVQSEISQVGKLLLELIKGFLLVEVHAFFDIMNNLQSKRESIRNVFLYAAEVDVALSVASLRAGSLHTCQPTFTESKKELRVVNAYHPLVTDCTPNSLHVAGKSVLITGSNMSGKSTFLRTLAPNSILAQTINTCFADVFVTPVLAQHTAIRIDDNLLQGVSYYLEEVRTLQTLMEYAATGNQHLFIIDEVFRGTNTIERIAAAKAVLSYLNQHDNIVIVSTHDIELVDLLKEQYDLYHFTETIVDNALIFDHQIKPVPLVTRNAIKLLELMNYPEMVVAEANAISSRLMQSKAT